MKADLTMKKYGFLSILLILCLWSPAFAKAVKLEGKKLISEKPAFSLTLPSDFDFIDSSSVENRAESSATRSFLFVKAKNQRAEEILIVQIADRTNPQAGPMTIPPLRPLADKRLLSQGKIDRKGMEIEYLIQSMTLNPDAPSLRPLSAKGITVPSHWALQGQCLFPYYGEHAVLIRYSKGVNSLGPRVSQEGKHWERDSISGNEKKALEAFQKTFMGMIESLRVQ
jgi:hypothetical protein